MSISSKRRFQGVSPLLIKFGGFRHLRESLPETLLLRFSVVCLSNLCISGCKAAAKIGNQRRRQTFCLGTLQSTHATRFSTVSVQGLQGTLQVDNQFGDVGLRNIAGPLTLESAFSSSRVQLLPVDGGYDFRIEVSNGSLAGNAPVERDVQRNMTTARGKHGEGLHPVVIKSDFGSVKVDLASSSR